MECAVGARAYAAHTSASRVKEEEKKAAEAKEGENGLLGRKLTFRFESVGQPVRPRARTLSLRRTGRKTGGNSLR